MSSSSQKRGKTVSKSNFLQAQSERTNHFYSPGVAGRSGDIVHPVFHESLEMQPTHHGKRRGSWKQYGCVTYWSCFLGDLFLSHERLLGHRSMTRALASLPNQPRPSPRRWAQATALSCIQPSCLTNGNVCASDDPGSRLPCRIVCSSPAALLALRQCLDLAVWPHFRCLRSSLFFPRTHRMRSWPNCHQSGLDNSHEGVRHRADLTL